MNHRLPSLPYEAGALAPHIDARTMIVHHDKHHAAYVAALNLALERAPELGERTALWLLLNLDQVPENIRTAIRNNAGAHLNHTLFWRAMSPLGSRTPVGPLADAIDQSFGSFEQFKTEFTEAGSTLFGSGWVWLVRTRPGGGALQVLTTSGDDNPLMQGHFPLLGNDVWEHAYYLKHVNRRVDYLQGWWPLVNWEEAAYRFERSSADGWLAQESIEVTLRRGAIVTDLAAFRRQGH